MTPQTIEQVQEVERESNGVLIKAREFAIIKTPEQYGFAADFLKTIKGMQKKVSETFDPIIEKTRAAWKESLGQKEKFFNPLETAERSIKNAMLAFDKAEEKKRKDEEARVQEEAKKKEALEKSKLEVKANKADLKGDTTKAEELRQQAQEVSIPVPTIQSVVPEVEGITKKKVWRAKIVDFTKIPAKYFYATDKQKEAHEAFFNAIAKANKNTLEIPGVEFYEEAMIASGSK